MDGICELCSEAVGYPAERIAPFLQTLCGGVVLFSTTHRVSVSRAAVDADISNYSVFITPLPCIQRRAHRENYTFIVTHLRIDKH